MKNCIKYLFFIFLFIFSACESDNVILNLKTSNWHTTTEQHDSLLFGYVYLHVEGSTTGEKVSIETHGDGVISYTALILDENKNFNDDILIAFTHQANNIPSKYTTRIVAYENAEPPQVNPEEGDIGSGKTCEISLESEDLKFIE